MPDERKYYVISDDNCKFESLTKEEILAAIVQAIESGEISDVDTGFVTTVKETNHNADLKFWYGTQTEYNALQTLDPDMYYIIKDDTRLDEIEAQLIDEMNGYHFVMETVTDYGNRLTSMSHTVGVNMAKVDELQYTVRQLTDNVNDFNEAVVEPRGKVIYSSLNPAIEYGEDMSVEVQRDLSKYLAVIVSGKAIGSNLQGDVLCVNNGAYITGTGRAMETTTGGDVIVNISLEHSGNRITANKSKILQIYKDMYSLEIELTHIADEHEIDVADIARYYGLYIDEGHGKDDALSAIISDTHLVRDVAIDILNEIVNHDTLSFAYVFLNVAKEENFAVYDVARYFGIYMGEGEQVAAAQIVTDYGYSSADALEVVNYLVQSSEIEGTLQMLTFEAEVTQIKGVF